MSPAPVAREAPVGRPAAGALDRGAAVARSPLETAESFGRGEYLGVRLGKGVVGKAQG